MAMGRLVKKTASLPAAVAAGGPLRLAVVADTHSQPHPAMPARLAELTPHAILHAGDVGDLAILDRLAAVAPVYAVRGNIDVRAPDLPDVLVLDVPAPAPLRILLTHIAVYGPKLRADVARMAEAEGAALVVCGHTHVPFIGTDRGLTVFNPGSIGPRRFTLPIVLGSIELTPAGFKLAHIDAATGQTWLPPA
jgi:putative phosphoesterase